VKRDDRAWGPIRSAFTTALTRAGVNKIEAGRSDPPLSTLEKLAKALKVKVGRLVE
jgi:transcriptional regulator with XRE-family HTH domain